MAKVVLILVVADNGLVPILSASVRVNAEVLILVVVDNGLVLATKIEQVQKKAVLILVVVDNGLVLFYLRNSSSRRKES